MADKIRGLTVDITANAANFKKGMDACRKSAMLVVTNRHRTRVCEIDRRKQAHKKHRLGAVGNTYHNGGKVARVA